MEDRKISLKTAVGASLSRFPHIVGFVKIARIGGFSYRSVVFSGGSPGF